MPFKNDYTKMFFFLQIFAGLNDLFQILDFFFSRDYVLLFLFLSSNKPDGIVYAIINKTIAGCKIRLDFFCWGLKNQHFPFY